MPRSASLKLALLAVMPILLLQSAPAASQVQGVIPVPTRTAPAAAVAGSPSQLTYTTPPIPTSNPNAQLQITVPVKLSGLPADAAVFRVWCRTNAYELLARRVKDAAEALVFGDIPAAAPGAMRSVYTEVTVPIVYDPSAVGVRPADLANALQHKVSYFCELQIARNRNNTTRTLQGDVLFQGGSDQAPGATTHTQLPTSTFLLENPSQTVGFVEGYFP